MDSLAKYIKQPFLHILAKKTPTSVGVKLCIYAQLLQYCYSNRVYMHDYCSTCINILVIFSLSFSLLHCRQSLFFFLSPLLHKPISPFPPSPSPTSSLQNPSPKTLPRRPLEPSNRVFKLHNLVFAVIQVVLLLCLLVSFFISCLWGY